MKVRHAYYPDGAGVARPENIELLDPEPGIERGDVILVLAGITLQLTGTLHGSRTGWAMNWHRKFTELRLYEVNPGNNKGLRSRPYHSFVIVGEYSGTT